MKPNRLLLLTASLIVFLYSCSKKSEDSIPPANTTIPVCATNSAPANGASVNGGANITLSWNAVSGATSYDVYLGTATIPTTTIATNVSSTSTSYNVPNTSSTYYWYVIPKNSAGSATGCTSKITSFTSTAIVIAAPPAFGFYVVGYFPSYRSLADVPDVKFRMCNVVNYAFFTVNTNNELTVPTTGTLPGALIAKAKAQNAKVFMSIADGGSSNFKNMASTAAGRTHFAGDVMKKVRQYGFDGVDVDWEYPTTTDGTDVTYTLLMKELSDSLHRDAKYYLTAAITAGKYPGGVRDGIRNEVFPYVDWFNIMAYDDFSTTVPYRHHSDFNLLANSLNYWVNTRGMPKEKAVMGIPAYGRPSGITQSNTVLAYRDIIAKGGSPFSDSAVVSVPSYPTPYTIYYNGQPTVKKKAIYSKVNGNGVMFWEKWHDTHDETSLIKAACDTMGRSY